MLGSPQSRPCNGFVTSRQLTSLSRTLSQAGTLNGRSYWPERRHGSHVPQQSLPNRFVNFHRKLDVETRAAFSSRHPTKRGRRSGRKRNAHYASSFFSSQDGGRRNEQFAAAAVPSGARRQHPRVSRRLDGTPHGELLQGRHLQQQARQDRREGEARSLDLSLPVFREPVGPLLNLILFQVCVKFLEVSNNWSGVIRFGFTCNDPNNLRNGLPKYACPDLTNKPGYWAKALAERFAERDTVLFFYVTQAGDVHFGINGEEKGVFFSGVETRGPLWAIVDVYGNSTAIELVDPRQQLNNSRRNLAAGGDASPDALERLILPSLTSLSIQSPPPRCEEPPDATAALQPLTPLPFHRTRGRNIRLSNDRCVATRADTEFSLGYVFTARPVHLGEKIAVQVLATEPMYVGALAFGLTSCDPAALQVADLPEDSDMLLDRPEYWVVSKYVCVSPQRGDELTFCITHTGEVQVGKNGGSPMVVMHVDHTLQLWAFWDVYGSTSKIRILGSAVEHPPPVPISHPLAGTLHFHPCRCPLRRGLQFFHVSFVSGSRNSSPPPRPTEALVTPGRLRVNLPSASEHSGPRPCCVPTTTSAEVVQCGTVLVVKLPPAHSNYLNQQNQQNQQTQAMAPVIQSPPPELQPSSSGTLLSTYSHTYIEVRYSFNFFAIFMSDWYIHWTNGSDSYFNLGFLTGTTVVKQRRLNDHKLSSGVCKPVNSFYSNYTGRTLAL